MKRRSVMPYRFRLFFRVGFFFALGTLLFWIVQEVRAPLDVLLFVFYPTVFFIPVAFLVIKFKKSIVSSKMSGITGIYIGNIIAKSVSHGLKPYLLIFSAEIMILLYFVTLDEYKDRDQLSTLNFQRITDNDFKKLIKQANLKYFKSWFILATTDHYIGKYHGVDTCIFSFKANTYEYLAVIMFSQHWQLPVIQLKNKTFYQHFCSMFKSENGKAENLGLSEDYYVEVPNVSANSRLSSEIIAEINKRESVVLELTPTAIFLYEKNKFTDEPENYLPAIQQAYIIAGLAVGKNVSDGMSN